MRNIRHGVGKTDVRDVPDRTDPPSPAENDRAVAAVIRWAIRNSIRPVCETLGLDFDATLARRAARERAS